VSGAAQVLDREVSEFMLLTGGKPLFLVARVVGGQSFESEVSDEQLWSPVEKVAAEELGPYLAELEVHA